MTAVGEQAAPSGRDQAAEWIAQMRPALVRFVRAQLALTPAAEDTAEDIVQETCLAVLRALPRYEDRGHPFSTFVFAVALNKVRDARRVASRAPAPTATIPDRPDAGPGPEEVLLQRTPDRELVQLLAALPSVSREVLLLRVAAGLSTAETAEILKMSTGAVRVALHRALCRLREMTSAEPQR
ncbi:MAG TPA: sigma-70 family RNA polymerase sigma factor [Mycobacteriales bacterium]|nr:sigma-70 family RNA polymerase sigma factor [Mycobacteriales bacterium]